MFRLLYLSLIGIMYSMVEILQTVAWPITVLFIFCVSVWKFKDAMDYLLRHLKVTHSATIFQSQPEEKTTLGKDEVKVSQKAPKNETPTSVDANTSIDWRLNAYIWEYRYLNFCLAPATQHILNWFYKNPAPFHMQIFHVIWSSRIYCRTKAENSNSDRLP